MASQEDLARLETLYQQAQTNQHKERDLLKDCFIEKLSFLTNLLLEDSLNSDHMVDEAFEEFFTKTEYPSSWQDMENELLEKIISKCNEKAPKVFELDVSDEDYYPDDEIIIDEPTIPYKRDFRIALIDEIFQTLSYPQKEIALRHFYQGKTVQELSDTLSLSREEVEDRLQNAKSSIISFIQELAQSGDLHLSKRTPISFFLSLLQSIKQEVPRPYYEHEFEEEEGIQEEPVVIEEEVLKEETTEEVVKEAVIEEEKEVLPVVEEIKEPESPVDTANQIIRRESLLVWGLLPILLLGVFFGIRYFQHQAYLREVAHQKALQSLRIEFQEDDAGVPVSTFEYSNQEIPVSSLVDSHTGQLRIEGDTLIDASVCGENETIFHLSKEDEYGDFVHWDITRHYEVIDSKGPSIEFKADSVSINLDASFDATANINGISDPVEGALKRVDEAPSELVDDPKGRKYEEGWYTLTSNVNTGKSGSYTVSVHAVDNHGNVSEKQYAVTVRVRAAANASLSSGGAAANRMAIYNYLTGTLGFSRAAACGVLANIYQESKFNPQSGSAYYGICQWGGGRLTNLQNYCASNGYDYQSLEGQIHFLGHELTGAYAYVASQMNACPNTSEGAYEASLIFLNLFERSGVRASIPEMAVAYFEND